MLYSSFNDALLPSSLLIKGAASSKTIISIFTEFHINLSTSTAAGFLVRVVPFPSESFQCHKARHCLHEAGPHEHRTISSQFSRRRRTGTQSIPLHAYTGIQDGGIPLNDGTSLSISPSPDLGLTPEEEEHDQLKSTPFDTYEALSSSNPGQGGKVHRHLIVLFLFFSYAIVATLAWTITCILCYHPIGGSTWHDTSGNYTSFQYKCSDRLRRSASVGLAVISTLGIPITSAIAARAATAYCQRNSDSATPTLTLGQMLTLADKGWSGYESIRDLLTPTKSKRVRTTLLIFAITLIGIGKPMTQPRSRMTIN